MGKTTTIDKLPDELEGILTEFLHSSYDARQEAVQAGAEFFRDKVSSATPKDTGKTAQSWAIKDKYPDHRYIGNTRVASNAVRRKTKGDNKGAARNGVPLVNILEFADNSPHKDFVRRCFDGNESQIYNIIKNKLGGK